MNLKDYKTISALNTSVLQKCLIDRSVDISDIIFFEGNKAKDLSFDKLSSKMYDILACCAIGAIPSVESTGADGYVWFTGSDIIEPIETKLCSIEKKNIVAGVRGGLYWSSDPTNFYNKAALRSRFQGCFDAGMTQSTLDTKARWTALICFDRDLNSVVGSWVMSPKVIFEQLQRRRNNASLTIKLNCFMENGSTMHPTVTSKDYFQWEKYQYQLAKQEGRVAKW